MIYGRSYISNIDRKLVYRGQLFDGLAQYCIPPSFSDASDDEKSSQSQDNHYNEAVNAYEHDSSRAVIINLRAAWGLIIIRIIVRRI